LSGNAFALFDLLDLPQLRVAFLRGLKVAGLLGVALDALRCLLVVVVDMLLYRVSRCQLVQDLFLLLVLIQPQLVALSFIGQHFLPFDVEDSLTLF